jgi:hypothetical protein
MPGFFQRLETAIGKEMADIATFAHDHFQGRMGDHGHTGMALIETIAEVCRNHPNIVGIGAGVLVERLLVAEKHAHDAHLAALAEHTERQQAQRPAKRRKVEPAPTTRAALKLKKGRRLKPGRLAFEVLGALILLKLANSSTRLFHHKHHGEVWFAPVARVHAISAAIATYNLIAAINDPKVSASRNGAILFFGTDAVKPLLNWYATHPISLHHKPPAAAVAAAAPPLQADAPALADPAPVEVAPLEPFMIAVPHDEPGEDVAPMRLP